MLSKSSSKTITYQSQIKKWRSHCNFLRIKWQAKIFTISFFTLSNKWIWKVIESRRFNIYILFKNNLCCAFLSIRNFKNNFILLFWNWYLWCESMMSFFSDHINLWRCSIIRRRQLFRFLIFLVFVTFFTS